MTDPVAFNYHGFDPDEFQAWVRALDALEEFVPTAQEGDA